MIFFFYYLVIIFIYYHHKQWEMVAIEENTLMVIFILKSYGPFNINCPLLDIYIILYAFGAP